MAKKGWAAIFSEGMFRKYQPYLPLEGKWIPTRAYIYTQGKWKRAGQTKYIMVPFLDFDELFLETYDSEWLLVPFIENDTL